MHGSRVSLPTVRSSLEPNPSTLTNTPSFRNAVGWSRSTDRQICVPSAGSEDRPGAGYSFEVMLAARFELYGLSCRRADSGA